MPAKEIKELRQSGKLEEALEMAQNELRDSPDNIWSKRNISWVYYEYLKMYAHEFNYDGFIEYLTKLKDLNLPENEVMVFDTVAWQIGKFLFSLTSHVMNESKGFDKAKHGFELIGKGKQVFEIVKELRFTKPSEQYTFIFKGFHKIFKESPDYIEFCDWWDFQYFQDEDFNKDEYNDKKIMSIVEQAYIAYSKVLLNGTIDVPGQFSRSLDRIKIKDFIDRLDTILETNPEYQYSQYYKAKLLLAVGDDKNVLSAFMPFAKQKRNDFWVWELIAEVFKGNKELQLACFCKALSLKTREDFLVKTRQQLAELLIDMNLFVEAKTEIEKIISVRQKYNWRIPDQIEKWMDSSWYVKVETQSDNIQLYSKHLKLAESILYDDIPEVFIAVEFVNSDKKILNFVKNKDYHGFLNYKGYKIKPKIGDVLKVRLEPIGNQGYYRILTINADDKQNKENCEAIKKESGAVKIREGQKFAFLNDVFISPEIVKKYNLKNNDEILCDAVMSYNKKKNVWGWKLISVNDIV